MKNTIKAALLLSFLGANITLSHASEPTNTLLPIDIVAVQTKVNQESEQLLKNTKNFVDEKDTWSNLIRDMAPTVNAIEKATSDFHFAVNEFTEAVSTARIDILVTEDIAKNSTSIEEMENKLSTQLAEFKQQEKDVANNKAVMIGLQKQFSDLKKEFNDFNAGTNGGIAGISAMGLLSTPLGENDMAVSAGIGHYSGAQAVAVGVTKRVNSTTVRAGASYNTGGVQPIIAAAGVGYEF